MDKKYYDINETECTLLQLVKKEPLWAVNRIKVGEKAIKHMNAINKLCDELKLSSEMAIRILAKTIKGIINE